MDDSIISLKKIRKLDERVFPELLKGNSYLTCINNETGKVKKMSIKALYNNDRHFWLKDNLNWSYYISSQLITTITEGIEKSDLELEERLSVETYIEKKIATEYQSLVQIRHEDRIEALSGALGRVNSIINSRNVSLKDKKEIMMEASSFSYLVNKVTLDEVVNMADSEARKATLEVSRLTEKIVGSLNLILESDRGDDIFFYSLVEKSNGVTLRHMVRTFLLSHRFLLFFNREMKENGLASQIRAKFEKNYRKWYNSLIPHIPAEELSLENVFKGGIRPIPEDEIKVYSAGFLLHDIGKQRYLDYYEGTDNFDSRKVESHAKTGYRMILQKTVYSKKIAAIAGYHHEYYGHESGYGYYRELCALMKLGDKNFRQDSCISYDLEDLQKFNSLSYLPVKFLEIVDVYDAITDPGRSYKSHLGTFEALKFMREDFVVRNKKIDLILFDLFVKFVKESGFSK